jgi:hypothetical protein
MSILSETSHNGEKKRVIETFPCIFTLRQMINFTLEKSENYDAISALIGYPMALKELEHQNLKEEKKKIKHNPISFLSMNPYIFKDSEDRLRKLKYETYKQDSNK